MELLMEWTSEYYWDVIFYYVCFILFFKLILHRFVRIVLPVRKKLMGNWSLFFKQLMIYGFFFLLLWKGGFVSGMIHEATLDDLTYTSGILERTGATRSIKFYIIKDGKRQTKKLDFALWCKDADEIIQYEGKQVAIWHRNYIVYQIKQGDVMLCDLTTANRHVLAYNIRFPTCIIVFFALICLFYFTTEVEEKYKGDLQ